MSSHYFDPRHCKYLYKAAATLEKLASQYRAKRLLYQLIKQAQPNANPNPNPNPNPNSNPNPNPNPNQPLTVANANQLIGGNVIENPGELYRESFRLSGPLGRMGLTADSAAIGTGLATLGSYGLYRLLKHLKRDREED